MKKFLLILVFLCTTSFLYSETEALREVNNPHGIFNVSWSLFQLGFVPEKYCHLFSGKADIYGLALGILVLEQESAVLSVAVTSGQHKNYGLQCAAVSVTNLNYALNISPLVSFIDRNYGIQIGAFNVETDCRSYQPEFRSGTPGLQIGAFNFGYGFQIGVLNYNKDAWIPVLPLFNWSK